MALTATDVLTRASDIIQDQTNIKWPQEELLRYLNDGRREVAIVRPDLYATSVAHVLLAGTKQALYAASENNLEQQLELERALQQKLGFGDDYREGVAAFNEKRKPAWKGR